MLHFLERWLVGIPCFVTAGIAHSGEEALEMLGREQPDVALVDLLLSGMDGLEFIRRAKKRRPELRAIVLSSLIDPLSVARVQEAKVDGYVEKNASPEILVEALQTVAAGGTFFSEQFCRICGSEDAKAKMLGRLLSRREQQVLAELLLGMSNKEIAEKLSISSRTVEFHRANLMAKLGAGNMAELILQVGRYS